MCHWTFLFRLYKNSCAFSTSIIHLFFFSRGLNSAPHFSLLRVREASASVLCGFNLNEGQALPHAVEERRDEHVRQTPPHYLDGRQEHHAAVDHRHHQPGRTRSKKAGLGTDHFSVSQTTEVLSKNT